MDSSIYDISIPGLALSLALVFIVGLPFDRRPLSDHGDVHGLWIGGNFGSDLSFVIETSC